MTKARIHKYVRKGHRYLGVIFGIQFLFWTIGGLYFSWTNIKKIRGEDIRKEDSSLTFNGNYISPDKVLVEIRKKYIIHQIRSIEIINLLGSLYYRVSFHDSKKNRNILADAVTGTLKEPLSKYEAIAVAKSKLKYSTNPASVEYITETNNHHEYRGKPLPAYAITFKGKVNSTLYVSAEMGTVQSFRNNSWRVFDFFWMLHTMDYKERDNFNNWTLRIFSLLGLITIISGFLLFSLSSKRKTKFI